MSILALQAEQQPLEVQALIARMQQVEAQLIEQTPQLPDALVHIHKMLLEHEELTHMLGDDDIMKLHRAHELHKQFHLVQKEVKNTKKASKKLSNAELDNI